MRKLPLLLSAIAAVMLFSACKKHNVTAGPSVGDYMMLVPGNYWIYESYRVDSNGVGSPGSMGSSTPFYDSIYVEKDTVIGVYIYHKLMESVFGGGNMYEALYYRDSLDYEVDNHGRIVFAPYDLTHTLFIQIVGQTGVSNDSARRVDFTTGNVGQTTIVPAGTFTTTALVTTWTFYPFAASHDPVYYRRQYARYAPSVGLVSETLPFYIVDPLYTERRLVRYHVQ